jgi:hypothetical protein
VTSLDTWATGADPEPVTVSMVRPTAGWFPDERGSGRALRATWHAELQRVVVSTWRDGACVGTVHLSPAEAAELVAHLADALADVLADVPADGGVPAAAAG